MKFVMGVIEKEARDKNVWMEKLADWNLERVTKMWGVVSPVIEAKYLKDVKRKNEARLLAKKMSDARAFGSSRNQRGKGQSDSVGQLVV